MALVAVEAEREFADMILSRHAERRCRQRGINERRLQQLLEHADLEDDVGWNCYELRVSHDSVRGILNGEKLARMAVILGESGEAVTVKHLFSDRRRRHRRRLKRRSRR